MPAQNDTRFIPLSALRDGHDYPGAAINARLTGQIDGLAQLAASIREEGLLQSLLVCPAPEGDEDRRGLYFVIDGNRRLAAMRSLAETGTLDGAHPVPAIIDTQLTPLDALRKSLTANIEKLPLHPVDQYETFAKVQATGGTPEEIAARYAVPERQVRQRLALGQLHAAIRTAWRAGEITAGIASLFTVQPDQTAQEKAFKRLQKKNLMHSPYCVRQELLGDANEANKYLRFIGREAYETQGGKIVEDLFSREDAEAPLYVSDSALLKKLVDHKLEEKCLSLLAEGWSWAEPNDSDNAHYYHWEKLDVKAKKATAEQKAKSGVIVQIDADGKFHLIYGLVKPSAKKTKDPAAKKKAGKAKTGSAVDAEEQATISMALRRALSAQLTKAIAAALRQDSGIALAALSAGFASWGNGLIAVTAQGIDKGIAPYDFTDALEVALRQNTETLLAQLANVTAGALHIQDVRAADALTQSLNGATVSQEIKAAFDAADYFASAPKALTLQAITETLGEQASKPLLTKPKTALAEFAVKHLAAIGWLPPELRTPHYQPPVAGNLPTAAAPEPEKAQRKSKDKAKGKAKPAKGKTKPSTSGGKKKAKR